MSGFFQYLSTKPDIVVFFYISMLLMVLVRWNKIPTTWGLKQMISMLNDRGGNIFVLLLMTMVFFNSSMRLFYYAFELLKDKQLTPDNAVLLMAIQFCSNSAFGLSMGALLKTMTGSDSQARSAENIPGGPQITKTEKMTATETTSTPPVVEAPEKPV